MTKFRLLAFAGVLAGISQLFIACEEETLPSVEASFSASETIIQEGHSVQFEDLSTGAPTQWSWTFEGGFPAVSEAQTPTVSYSAAGTYSVTLTSSNAENADTETKQGFITVYASVNAAFSSDKTKIPTDGTVTFTDQSAGEPTHWQWTFEGGMPATSTEANPTVTYPTIGIYKVTLTASNEYAENTVEKTDYIQVFAPITADFTASDTVVQEGSSITFTDNSSGDPTQWKWIFEGGTPGSSNEPNPIIAYETAGMYEVTLIASNEDTKDTLSKTNLIRVFEPVYANFEASAMKVIIGETINFADLSEGNPTQWNWTFEGGAPAASTDQNPSVTYNSAGTFEVTLIAGNADISDTVKTLIQVFDESQDPCLGNDNGEIYIVVEDQPTPVGGMQAFYEFISKNMKYPIEASRMGIEGRVFVQFVVSCDGSITDVQTVKGIGAGCDEEAERLLSISPKWNPGLQRGKPVRVRMVLPITFQLG